MSELDINFVKDGQKAIATIAQSGDIVSSGGEIDATCVVQTDDGKQKAVKTTAISGTIVSEASEISAHALVETANGDKELCVKTYSLGGDESGGGGGGDFIGIPREVSEEGEYGLPQTDYIFTLPENATSIGNYAFYYGFYRQEHLIEAVFNTEKINGSQAFSNAFENCTNLTTFRSTATEAIGTTCFSTAFKYCISFKNFLMPNLKKINNSFAQTFEGVTSIEQFELPSLEEITGGYAFSNAFNGCTSLKTVSFPKLKKCAGTASAMRNHFSNCFNGCTSLTDVNFNSLEEITRQNTFQNAFNGCTSLTTLSFPSLKSTSFGSYTNQFNNMLQNVTGCTVHFPSNLQSVIGSWADVTAGFGGTNTTVSFDLPATE